MWIIYTLLAIIVIICVYAAGMIRGFKVALSKNEEMYRYGWRTCVAKSYEWLKRNQYGTDGCRYNISFMKQYHREMDEKLNCADTVHN